VHKRKWVHGFSCYVYYEKGRSNVCSIFKQSAAQSVNFEMFLW
jgi:hypothetical protein